MDSYSSGQGTTAGACKNGNERSGFMKGEERTDLASKRGQWSMKMVPERGGDFKILYKSK
jgi:hypothetical protein